MRGRELASALRQLEFVNYSDCFDSALLLHFQSRPRSQRGDCILGVWHFISARGDGSLIANKVAHIELPTSRQTLHWPDIGPRRDNGQTGRPRGCWTRQTDTGQTLEPCRTREWRVNGHWPFSHCQPFTWSLSSSRSMCTGE